MTRFQNCIPIAALAVVSTMFLANEAKADFQVEIITNGSSKTTYTTSSQYYSASTNSYDITFTEANGTALIVTASEAVNAQGVTLIDVGASHSGKESYSSLTIVASVTNVPTNPNSLGYVYQNTGPYGVGTTTMETWGGANTVFAPASILDTGTITVPAGITSGTKGFTANSAYSITTEISLTGLTKSGDSFNLDDSDNIYPSPLPGGLVLILTGIPVAAAAGFRRCTVARACSNCL